MTATSDEQRQDPISRNRYVLVVGDDTTNVVFISLLLQRLGYYICTAGSAENALNFAGAVVPCLIISDLKLPGMSAAQMIRPLREREATAGVPVVIMLDDSNPRIVKKCKEAGAVACIAKPVDPEELYRVVQTAVESTPRGHIRIATRLRVTINDQQLDCVTGECAIMLSSRGMYVRTQTRYPVSTVFPVRIDLDGRSIPAEAKVIYSFADGEGPYGQAGLGLYFTAISAEDQDRLQRYINNEVTKDLTPVGAAG